MTWGPKSLRWALGALTVVLLAVAFLPAVAGAQHNEYDLNLPGSGDSGSSGSSDDGSEATAPVTPTAPTVTTPTTTEIVEDDAAGGGKKRRKPDGPDGPTAPVLPTSAVNATAGPQEIPPLRVESDGDGGIPTLALVLASLAAACCILALWRLRFLRELPAAPRPRASRAEASS